MNYAWFYHLFEFLYSHKLLDYLATSLDLSIILRLHTIIKESTFDEGSIEKLMLIF